MQQITYLTQHYLENVVVGREEVVERLKVLSKNQPEANKIV